LATAQGGQGNDRLFGAGADDILNGGRGQDDLRGHDGNDKLYGGQGADHMLGGNGNDLLIGGIGADRMIGGKDNDVLRAGSGKDMLIGGSGDDELTGGSGADITDFRDADTVLIDLSGILPQPIEEIEVELVAAAPLAIDVFDYLSDSGAGAVLDLGALYAKTYLSKTSARNSSCSNGTRRKLGKRNTRLCSRGGCFSYVHQCSMFINQFAATSWAY